MNDANLSQPRFKVHFDGVGREQVHEEAAPAEGDQQQRALGLHLQGARQRGAGELLSHTIYTAY